MTRLETISKYLIENYPTRKEEIRNVQSGNYLIPYDYVKKYDYHMITVFHDAKGNFVNFLGRKVYFPYSWSTKRIKYSYNQILIEQDRRSPHCYFPEFINVPIRGKVVVDAGGAEGIYTIICLIKGAKRVYIVEGNPEWINCIKLTFDKELKSGKVVLIDKYISETNTLDNLIPERVDVLKADIEGWEQVMLDGATKITSELKSIELCTYHKQYDMSNFSNYLITLGFKVIINPRIIIWGKNIKKPYIRTGMIYGIRK